MKFVLVAVLLFCKIAEGQTPSAVFDLPQADSLFAIGAYQEAIAIYKEIEGAEKQLAEVYATIGNKTKARAYYEAYIISHDNHVREQFQYAKLSYEMGYLTVADSLFQSLIQAHPTNATYLYYSGMLQENSSDSLATETYKEVLQLAPMHTDAMYKVARYALQKRNFKKADSIVSIALTADPESRRFLNLSALLHFHTEQYEEAISLYQNLFDRNYDTVQLRENLAECYIETLQFEAAIDQYNHLLKAYGDANAEWHYQLGLANMSLRYDDVAEKHFKRALVLQDIPVDYLYLSLATLYNKQKKYKEAYQAFQQGIKENPENELAVFMLATAADNYFSDKSLISKHYQNYLGQFGDKGRFSELCQRRIRDLKEAIHFEGN
ncbi:tetratricopeptide repeat protein [Flavobacteriaceae bacterium TK19130]|nr:tetratricopeptide repeat protein [Thermobacterium salinum]